MLNIIRAFVAILIVMTIGYAILLLILGTKRICSRLLAFSFSIGLGFGFLAMSCLLSLAVTKRIFYSPEYIALPLSIMVIVYYRGIFWFSRLPAQPRRQIPAPQTEKPLETKGEKVIFACGILLVAILIFAASFNFLIRPIFHFDSCVIWAHKAKILWHEHTVFCEAIQDPSRNHFHPAYPLLLPISMAWLFENMAEADDRAVRALFLFFFLGLISATYKLIRIHADRIISIVMLAAFLLAPMVYRCMKGGAASGHADMPLCFYFVISAISILYWMQERDVRFLILGACFSVCAGLVKNEGLIFAINLFLATIGSFLYGEWMKHRKSPGKGGFTRLVGANLLIFCQFAVYILIVALLFLPWLLLRSELPKINDEQYLLQIKWSNISSGISRLPKILKELGREFVNIKSWGVLWILAGSSLVGLCKLPTANYVFLSIVLVLQLGAYVVIYVVTPNDLVFHISSSLGRILLPLLPFGLSLFSCQLSRLRKEAAGLP